MWVSFVEEVSTKLKFTPPIFPDVSSNQTLMWCIGFAKRRWKFCKARYEMDENFGTKWPFSCINVYRRPLYPKEWYYVCKTETLSNELQKFNIVDPLPIKNTIGKLFWRLFFPPRHRTKNKFRESDRSRFFGFFLEKYPSKEGRGSKVYCL